MPVNLKTVSVALVSLALIGFAGYRIYQFAGQSGREVSYPYWCAEGHVFDVSELKSAGWEVHPEGSSDSVVVCIEADCEAKAYPAVECAKCGTFHLLHIWKSNDCPVCNPAVGKKASEQGIDLTPPELPN